MYRSNWIRTLFGLTLVFGLNACASSASKPSQATLRYLPTIPFTIQVGAFSTSMRAAKYASTLRSRGLDAYYFIDRDRLYKVRFERFQTRQAAQARAASLKRNGIINAYYIAQPGTSIEQIDSQSALRHNIVQTARRFIGKPYRWGGESANVGFDCSGLTMTVYRLNGLELPRNSQSQFLAGSYIAQQMLQPGDLVFFATGKKGRVSHVGIYSGGQQFIHASDKGKKIQSASLDNPYFRKRYMGARSYF